MFFLFFFFSDPLTISQKTYLHEHGVVVSKDMDSFHWQEVAQTLAPFDVVALGEFNHGSYEVFETRNQLIRLLHEQYGFDFILFESGLGEVAAVYRDWDNLPSKHLTSGFFFGWRNQSFQDLMNYARDNRIKVAGFDVQRTGSTFTSALEKRFPEMTQLEIEFVKLKKLLGKSASPKEDSKVLNLIQQYKHLQNTLTDPFEKRVLENRITFLNYMLRFHQDGNYSTRWAARDQAMAENVIWLLGQNPGHKAIIIAHNYHISKYNPKEEVMGEIISKKLGNDYFALGVFAGQGSFHNNSGQPEQMSPPNQNRLDIKYIIASDTAKLTYLPIPDREVSGNDWLFKPIVVNDTFINLSRGKQLILSKWFDGLLLYDQISPPPR